MIHLGLWVSCLLVWFTFCLAEEETRVNVALRKPVFGVAAHPDKLTDGGETSVTNAHVNDEPMYYVDLLDHYELDEIEVTAQNHWQFKYQGLNETFSIYVWDEYTPTCDINAHNPWIPVGEHLIFQKRAEKAVLKGPFKARYIIAKRDQKDRFEPIKGIALTEIRAYGKKVRDGDRGIIPEDGPPVTNRHRELRQQIWGTQSRMWVEQSWGEYQPDGILGDVAIAWHHNRINTVAAKRGEGRVFAMSGIGSMNRLVSDQENEELRKNVKQWLNEADEDAPFKKVTDAFEPGDILLISRADKFDVAQVAEAVRSGKNSIIIGYAGTTREQEDSATELMRELGIGYLRHNGKYMGRYVVAKDYVNSVAYIPLLETLKMFKESWYYFRTELLASGYPARELSDPTVQQLIGEILDKYRLIMDELGFCRFRQYRRNAQTATAVQNYNRLLLFQEGKQIRRASGVWSVPGDVLPGAKPTAYTVTFTIDRDGSFFPMGAHAKAGEAFRYKVLSHNLASLRNLQISVNPQTDGLHALDVARRLPWVFKSQPLQEEGQMVSPFGGPITVKIYGGTNITIRFENVYRYPWFDIRDPKTYDTWEEHRKKYNNVPYTMIHGDNMISMMLTRKVVLMDKDNVRWSTLYYDNMVKMIHNYRGSDYATARQEVFVTDEQLSIGWGHSGYPWKGQIPWEKYFRDMEYIHNAHSIHIPHELGHNLAAGVARFHGGSEIVNLIYTPLVHTYLLGLRAYYHPYAPGSDDTEFKKMLSIWRGGRYRGVLVSHYNYYGRMFSPALIGNTIIAIGKSGVSIKTEADKANAWVKTLCNESGYDLAPFNSLWHFPFNQETRDFCGQFPCYFPDDNLTQQVPEIVDKILKDYGKECQRSNPRQVEFKRDVMRGMNTTKPQSIFIYDEA